jgi:hypothetical protein
MKRRNFGGRHRKRDSDGKGRAIMQPGESSQSKTIALSTHQFLVQLRREQAADGLQFLLQQLE